jgi:hypothetical protein
VAIPKEMKRKLVEGLWQEIEKAVYRSPDVRQTLVRLTEIDPKADVSEYNLHLDIEKLSRLIKEEMRQGENGVRSTFGEADENTGGGHQEQLPLFNRESLSESKRTIFAILLNFNFA